MMSNTESDHLPTAVIVEIGCQPEAPGLEDYEQDGSLLLSELLRFSSEISENTDSVKQSNCLPSPIILSDGIEAFSIDLETKYYSAKVRLCRCRAQTIGTREFADSVEAVVLHFDAATDADLAKAERWLTFLKHWEPQVQLLVCGRVDEAKREATVLWCIANEFELVELHPSEESLEEAEECGETVGVKRIIQALKSHSWPNMIMKDRDESHLSRLQDFLNQPDDDDEFSEAMETCAPQAANSNEKTPPPSMNECPNSSENVAKKSDEVVSVEITRKVEEIALIGKDASLTSANSAQLARLFASDFKQTSAKSPTSSSSFKAIGSDSEPLSAQLFDTESAAALFAAVAEDGGDIKGENEEVGDIKGRAEGGDASFEALFQRLAEMKETAAAMPPDQRRGYAEQMTFAFWRAIGGDEAEIADLTDSSDNESKPE